MMWDVALLRDELKKYVPDVHLPDWLKPGWPSTPKQMLAAGGASLLALGFSAYLYIKIFCDWLWDDLILARGIQDFVKKVGELDAMYDPSIKLEEHAANIPNKPFLLFEDQKYTFAQTNSKSNQIANALSKLGVTREQKLALLMRNKPELLLTYYGCLKIAVPVSFLNTNLRTKALMHCVRDGGTKNLLVDNDTELLEAVKEIADELEEEGVKVIVLGRSEKYENFEEVVGQQEATPPDTTARQGMTTYDVAQYIFTSGTTGLPKAAKITYSRVGRAAAFFSVFGVKTDDIAYSPLPLYHSAALMTFNGSALLHGCTFAFAKKFSVRHFWEDCDKHGATVVQYIGETCRYLLTRPPSDADRKHKVRMAIGNGLRRDIWAEFKNRFNIKRIGEFYAATEGNVFFGNMRNKLGSCGRKSPLSTMSDKIPKVLFLQYDTETDSILRGEDGMCKQTPRGQPGLLVAQITDKSRFDGYTSNKQTSSKIVRNVLRHGDSYFNTGDLMLWDKDYHVYFVDRIGDTFRWKGENVSTQEVGNLISELDAINDCSVYGVPIPGMDGKCGMAAIVLTSGTLPTHEVLKAIYIQGEHYLPSYARPVFIRFMPELHLTGTYKHQKFKLQQEGFDSHRVPDVYVHDLKQATYIPLTADVYDSIVNGRMKV